MSDSLEPLEAEETARTLDGVDRSEDAVEQRRITGSALQLDDIPLESNEVLAAFRQELTEYIIHGNTD